VFTDILRLCIVTDPGRPWLQVPQFRESPTLRRHLARLEFPAHRPVRAGRVDQMGHEDRVDHGDRGDRVDRVDRVDQEDQVHQEGQEGPVGPMGQIWSQGRVFAFDAARSNTAKVRRRDRWTRRHRKLSRLWQQSPDCLANASLQVCFACPGPDEYLTSCLLIFSTCLILSLRWSLITSEMIHVELGAGCRITVLLVHQDWYEHDGLEDR
jgi:hypothetical protein